MWLFLPRKYLHKSFSSGVISSNFNVLFLQIPLNPRRIDYCNIFRIPSLYGSGTQLFGAWDMQEVRLVIECDACNSRFGLDRKLIEGYRAARVRCRQCGGPIDIAVPAPVDVAVPEAAPDNLVDLHAFRENYRRKMQAGTYDISGSITAEIPCPEPPFPIAEPKGRTPAELAPSEPEESYATVRPGILEEPFPGTEEEYRSLERDREEPLPPDTGSRRRRSRRPRPAGFSGTRILLFTAVCGTTLGAFLIYLLIRIFT